MKPLDKTLYFVAGIAPTPEEQAEINSFLEPTVIAAVGTEGEEGYQPEQRLHPNVEIISVEKMPADVEIDLDGVKTLAGSVPTNYSEAFAEVTGQKPIAAKTLSPSAWGAESPPAAARKPPAAKQR